MSKSADNRWVEFQLKDNKYGGSTARKITVNRNRVLAIEEYTYGKTRLMLNEGTEVYVVGPYGEVLKRLTKFSGEGEIEEQKETLEFYARLKLTPNAQEAIDCLKRCEETLNKEEKSDPRADE